MTHLLLLASAILTRVLSASWFDKATTVSCYLSMPAGEVDTSAITSAILHSGTQLPMILDTFHLSPRSAYSRSENLIPYCRENFVRAQGGRSTPGGDGPAPNLRR